ncbi:sodium/glutamate symporter [Sedimentibacter sp. zth1]|uniref:sodium/glutamate symporter n=1 Tax=Sedimentibacter sp. zth1 TaxID=2816908 RepID=UPI001A92B85D|nr:sodium/glutamate symporter [Sedimentibacter sp. zth1]QSX06301.1 sodium/glutamate symporter [Sedimentibacter sp. zth1]
MIIKLDLYQTVAMAVLVFYIGSVLKKRVSLFEKYCIPSPVVGGILFALLTLLLNVTGLMTIETDDTMRNVFMTLFFTSVGYTASLKLLKKGGIQVIVFVLLCTVLVILQNVVGVSLATFFKLKPILGLCVGSIPMIGGHGTAGSIGTMLENMGVSGAATVSVASATFGLIMGGMIGGPIAKKLISKNNLSSTAVISKDGIDDFTEERLDDEPNFEQMLKAFSMLFLAAGIGSIISKLIQKTGITFPSYIGAMLAAAFLRNVSDVTRKFSIMEDIIGILGSVSLTLFLSMALMGLKLWELAELALPLVVMLIAQTVLMILFSYFITYNVMGRDYEAAVMSSACCGFGMGATPNAIANMQAITSKYGPAPKAYFIVPLVGSLFIDFINASIITIFINWLL